MNRENDSPQLRVCVFGVGNYCDILWVSWYTQWGKRISKLFLFMEQFAIEYLETTWRITANSTIKDFLVHLIEPSTKNNKQSCTYLKITRPAPIKLPLSIHLFRWRSNEFFPFLRSSYSLAIFMPWDQWIFFRFAFDMYRIDSRTQLNKQTLIRENVFCCFGCVCA